MKPDGVTMDTTDTSEAAAEPSASQNDVPVQQEQAANDAPAPQVPEGPAPDGPPAADTTVKSQAVSSKIQTSGSKSQPAPAPHRSVSNVKSSNNHSAKTTPAKKPAAAPAAKPSTGGAVPRRPVSVAAVSPTVKKQTLLTDRRPVTAARQKCDAAATATNGSKRSAASVNRRTAADTLASRNAGSRAAAPSTSLKPEGGAVPKSSRTAKVPITSRPASAPSRSAPATTRAPTSATSRMTASRATTAPSAGRTPAQTTVVKKDASRPVATRRPPASVTATTGAKKTEPPKPKFNSTFQVSAAARAADPRTTYPRALQTRTESPGPAATKKPDAAAARLQTTTKSPLGRPPPASPTSKPANVRAPLNRPAAKPTQAVLPFSVKTLRDSSTSVQRAPGPRLHAKTAAPPSRSSAAPPPRSSSRSSAALPPRSSTAPPTGSSTAPPPRTSANAASAPPSPPEESAQISPPSCSPPPQISAAPPTAPSGPVAPQDQPHSASPSEAEPTPAPGALPPQAPQDQPHSASPSEAEPTPPPGALPPQAPGEPASLSMEQTPSTCNPSPVPPESGTPLLPAPTWKDEDEEDERSQLVSLSEMSGTTQPTEESRPGSAGPAGGAVWRAGGALLSELDSEEVSGSQQGASELSAPGVLEGTESTDELGDGSLKGASAGSPDLPANDFEEDDSDRVCDMDVDSERTDEPQRRTGDEEEEDDDMEMASEDVTESGLESYGNADEDDFAEVDRLDNLNRAAQLPPPPQLPSAPAAQWDQPNPLQGSWAEQRAMSASVHPQADAETLPETETPTQPPAEVWMELSSPPERQLVAPPPATGTSQSETLSSDAAEEPAGPLVPPPPEQHNQDREEDADAPPSNPSSSSATDDEASDMEGEAQLEDSLEPSELQPSTQRCLSTVDEGDEVEPVEEAVVEDSSPDSHILSAGDVCPKSPGVFCVEGLCAPTQQLYIQCGTQEEECAEPGHGGAPHPEDAATSVNCVKDPDDLQPPYFTAICEKTENFTGFTAPPHRRHHSAHATSCDVINPPGGTTAGTLPRLTCADLPPRTVAQQALSPQLRRLEQHQRHLLELQRSREQKTRPLEEAEQQRKRREEEEQRRKKEEAEEEIKRNEEEPRLEEDRRQQLEDEEQRKHLHLQLQQQEEELKQRQQLLQWQQELQQSDRGTTLLLSPSSGLCTIYEALESSDNEAQEEERRSEGKESLGHEMSPETDLSGEQVKSAVDQRRDCPSSRRAPSHTDSPRSPSNLSQDGDSSSPCPPETPEHLSPSDLDWGQKLDIVQQLINQTLLLNRDRCSSLLLPPGGAGGTLSPLESSLWPRLLTPPSATVTSVSSFSPEATGASPQGEWTVVELETHH